MKVKSSLGMKSLRASKEKTKASAPFTLSGEPQAHASNPLKEAMLQDSGHSPAPPANTGPLPAIDALPPAPEESNPSDFENLGQLPASYGSNHLYLIARDPHWLFCYWDVDWECLPESVRNAKFSLRLIQEDGQEMSRTPIDCHAPNWFLPVPVQGKTYFVELGYESDYCPWNCLQQSDLAYVPVQFFQQNTNDLFATVPLHLSFQRLLDAVQNAMHSGESLLQTLARIQGDKTSPFTGEYTPPWSANQRTVLEALLGTRFIELVSMGSGELGKVLREKIDSADKQNIPSHPIPFTLSSDNLSSDFSGSSLTEQPPKRAFFMHVNAEVIFYGGTHPDAKVTINDKPVQLREDGTFHYHFPFPDGVDEVSIVAVSPDGTEERTAILRFQRDTTRQGMVENTPQPGSVQKNL